MWMNGGVWFNFDLTPQLVPSASASAVAVAVAVAVAQGPISTVANELFFRFSCQILFGTST